MSREVAAAQGSRELCGRRSREPLRRNVDNMGQAFQSVPFWRWTARTPFAHCGRRYPDQRRELHLTQPPNRQNLTQTFTLETLDSAATHDLIRSRYSARVYSLAAILTALCPRDGYFQLNLDD